MTTAINDGILGLEAKVEVGGGVFTFNDLEATSPRVKLTKITGLHSLPEADDYRDDRVDMPGQLIYPGQARGKTISYEGVLQASDQAALSALRQTFRAAVAERSDEVLIKHIPNASYGSVVWGYTARVLAFDCDDEIIVDKLATIPTPYQRGFVFTVRMSDPRYRLYSSAFEDLWNADNLQIVARAEGGAPADPEIDVHTVVSGNPVTITNESVTVDGNFATLVINPTASGTLQILFRTREIMIDGVDHVFDLDIAASNWWDEGVDGLAPGDNLVRVSGAGTWDLRFDHRSW